jgi:hypothetical protein
MDITNKILKNKRYKELIDQLDDETLELIANDHLKALEAAKKGIQREEPEKTDDVEYLETMANEMQKMAQRVLSKKSHSSQEE